MYDKKQRNLGRIAMFVTTLIWGGSFVMMKNTVDSMPWAYALAYRLTGASVVLALIGIKSFRNMSKKMLVSSALIGIILFIGYALQVSGLQYTTPGKSAFLTVTYCVIVPFLCWMLYKKRPDRYNIAAAVMCLSGVGLVSLQSDLSIGFGDVLTLLCGLAFAVQIVAIDKAAKDADVMLFGILQTAASAVCAWICAPILHGRPVAIPQESILPMIYLCVMATGFAFALQLYGQKRLPAASASIILSMESVMGTAISVIFFGEELTLKLAAGFALIFAAIVVSESKLSFLRKKRPAEEEEYVLTSEEPGGKR